MSISDLNYPEVRYSRTGLKAVVCRLTFNPILKIGQEVPAAFQDLVRHEFPKLFQEESTGFRIGPGPSMEALPPQPAVWRFRTEDDCWTAGLAVNFLSLESTRYEHFPDFESRFRVIQQALESVYQTDHYVRVGLRYINAFSPDEFPGGWGARFNPMLLGVIADSTLAGEVKESRGSFILAGDDWTIVVRHGTENGTYRLDIDHASEAGVRADEVGQRLKEFNGRIYQVFRWAITSSMHEEMEATPNE